jgi:hypothetical protein
MVLKRGDKTKNISIFLFQLPVTTEGKESRVNSKKAEMKKTTEDKRNNNMVEKRIININV